MHGRCRYLDVLVSLNPSLLIVEYNWRKGCVLQPALLIYQESPNLKNDLDFREHHCLLWTCHVGSLVAKRQICLARFGKMAKTLGGNFQFGHLRDLDVKQIWDQFRYIEYWWLNPVILNIGPQPPTSSDPVQTLLEALAAMDGSGSPSPLQC